MVIGDLGDHLSWLPALARWHYDQWGPLTGASSFDGYVALLTEAAASRTVPSVLIAMADGELLGSANLVACDLPPRADTMACSTFAVANGLIGLVALSHVGFLVLEMFFWDHPVGRRIFGTTPEVSASSVVVAGVFGGLTAKTSILLTQALPAALALGAVLLAPRRRA